MADERKSQATPRDPASTSSSTRKRTAIGGVVLMVLGLAALLGITPTAGWDLWWHMRAGELAWTERSLLPTDPFSYAFLGETWRYKDLLADVLLWSGYEAIGFGWFALLTAVAVASPFAAFGVLVPRHARGALVLAISAGWTVMAVQYRLVERPLLFSLILFPLFLALLERVRGATLKCVGATARALVPLVLLLWSWAWLHRAVLTGLVLTVGFAGWSTLAWLLAARLGPRSTGWRQAPVDARSLLAVWAAALVAPLLCLINPFGTALYVSGVDVVQSAMLREYISEWARPSGEAFLRSFPSAVALWLAAAAAWLAAVRLASRERAGTHAGDDAGGGATGWHAALLGLLVALSLSSARWIPYASYAAGLTLAISLPTVLGWLRVPRDHPPHGALALIVVVALVVSFFQRHDAPFRLGLADDRYPVAAWELAEQEGLRGRVVNSYVFGGYLIWRGYPGTRVLVDGRADTVYPPAFVVQAIEAQKDPAAFAEMRGEDGATWVVAANWSTEPDFVFLGLDDGWVMVHWSEAAILYVDREAHPEVADRHAYRFFGPAGLDATAAAIARRHADNPELLRAAHEELLRMVQASPEGLRANAALAVFYHFVDPSFHDRRDRVMDLLMLRYPEHEAVEQLRQRLYGRAAPAGETQ